MRSLRILLNMINLFLQAVGKAMLLRSNAQRAQKQHSDDP